MAGKPSAGVEAAKKEYMKAPADNKPEMKKLAKKHKVALSSVYRAKKGWDAEAANG